jgi:hypothetical protein
MSATEVQDTRGKGAFWGRLAKTPDFYNTLDLLPDARMLFDTVAHLSPTILTGLPVGKWAEPQKRAWVERHFPGTPVITGFARDKHKHGLPGDVLVDDSIKLAAAWEEMGGHFIHHEKAERSLAALRHYFEI